MVIISMMVMCNANVIARYDRRRSGLSSAPLDMEYDNSITYYWSFKHDQSINQSSDLIYLEVSNWGFSPWVTGKP